MSIKVLLIVIVLSLAACKQQSHNDKIAEMVGYDCERAKNGMTWEQYAARYSEKKKRYEELVKQLQAELEKKLNKVSNDQKLAVVMLESGAWTAAGGKACPGIDLLKGAEEKTQAPSAEQPATTATQGSSDGISAGAADPTAPQDQGSQLTPQQYMAGLKEQLDTGTNDLPKIRKGCENFPVGDNIGEVAGDIGSEQRKSYCSQVVAKTLESLNACIVDAVAKGTNNGSDQSAETLKRVMTQAVPACQVSANEVVGQMLGRSL